MPPTLVDIARETQTSVSTVSRVLSGGAMASRISRETRQRVQAAADRMGYRPNLLARSLRTRKTFTIGLMVSDIANPFFGQIGSLIEQSLARHGYAVMLCNSSEDLERESNNLRMITQKGIDGLILVPLVRTRKALLQYVPESLPLVILDRPIPGINATVAHDQDQVAGVLADTLHAAGVRKICLVCGPQHVITHRRRCEIFTERFEVIDSHEGPAQKETGRQAFIKFQGHAPHAIVCTNNFLAQGVIDSIAQIEKPPVIGVFDEIPGMHLLPLPIACSMQDIPALAEGCVTQLLKLLNGKAEAVEPIVLQARAVTNRAFQALNKTAQAS